MKILHISASYKPAYIYGGPIMSVAKLCEELGKAENLKLREESPAIGESHANFALENSFPANSTLHSTNSGQRLTENKITVYTTLANGKEELPYPSGSMKIVDDVEVHYFKRLTKDHSHFSPALYWKLWKTAKDFDIIHIHAWWNLVSVCSCLIAVLKGRKIVFTPRGTLSNYSFNNRTSVAKKLFHQFVGKPLLQRCHIHTTSKKEEKDMRTLLNPKSITTFPNLVALPWNKAEVLLQKHRSFSGSLRLLFLSRIEQKKGLELLFRVLSRVSFSYHLQIAGTGDPDYIQELKQLSKQSGIEGHLSWLGMLNGEQKLLQMAKNDLLMLPSYDENFANVVIESLFTGTPVLITENVGLSDYVLEKDLGWVCKRTENDLTARLYKAYERIRKNEIDRVRLQKIIEIDFKEANIIGKYIKMYTDVSSRNSFNNANK